MAEQTPNARRRLYFIGATIGAVMLIIILVLVILLLARSSSGSNYSCTPSRTMPDLTALREARKNIASASLTALANMIGYIYYYEKGFVPLVLTKVEDNGSSTLTLTSECATVIVRYNAAISNSTGGVINLSVIDLLLPEDLLSAKRTGQPALRYCLVELQDEYHFPWTTRFSCLTRVNHVCRNVVDTYNYAKPVAELVLDSLEFELMASVSIKSGQFDRLPQPGCCGAFTH